MFLSLLGYNILAIDDVVYFEDLTTNIFTPVVIAKSCAGINSMIILVSAIISFILVETNRINMKGLLVIFAGILTAYFSNLFRMAIILIIGHHKGIYMLVWAHEYLGWIIFTIFVYAFWVLIFDKNKEYFL